MKVGSRNVVEIVGIVLFDRSIYKESPDYYSLLPLFKAVFLSLVKVIHARSADVDDLRTAVAVLFLQRALPAVVSIRYSGRPAHDALALERPVVALVANVDQNVGPHVAVADDTLAITLFAQTAQGDPGLLPAEHQVRVVLRHDP